MVARSAAVRRYGEHHRRNPDLRSRFHKIPASIDFLHNRSERTSVEVGQTYLPQPPECTEVHEDGCERPASNHVRAVGYARSLIFKSREYMPEACLLSRSASVNQSVKNVLLFQLIELNNADPRFILPCDWFKSMSINHFQRERNATICLT